MAAKNIVGRLKVLPLKHKVIAAAIEVACIVGALVCVRYLPPWEYTSSALLSFDRDAAARSELVALHLNQAEAGEWAQSILSDNLILAVCRQLGLFVDESGNEAARFRSRLTLSAESNSNLRVTWRGADRSQTAAATNAVASLLTSAGFDDTTRETSNATPAVTSHPGTPFTPKALIERSQPFGDAQSRANQAAAHLEYVRNDQKQLRLDVANADRKLAYLEEEARRLEASVSKANGERQGDLAARQPLMAQLAAEKKNLEALRARYTDDYPDVQSAQEKVAETEKRLAALPAAPTGADADLSRLNSVRDEMKHVSAESQQLLDRLAKVEADIRRQEAKGSVRGSGLARVSTASQPGQNRAKLSGPTSIPRNSRALTSTEDDGLHPFKIVEGASHARPTNNSYLLAWLAAVAAFLSGILYLLLVTLRFSPVRSGEALNRMVPDYIADLGAIPGMNRWRHNL